MLAWSALLVLGAAPASTHAHARYGGTLVYGLSGGEPDSLDPTVSRTAQASAIFDVMCQPLYRYDARAQLVPVFAAAAPVVSKDKLTYTIQLRQGIQFNDGTPLNAQAVVTTVQRYMTYPGSSRNDSYASVDSVSATGPYTVVFHLRERDSAFTGNTTVLSPTQLDKAGDDFAAEPVCLGPFMFDHVVGDNVTVIKSPYYWDRQHVYLDKIVYKTVPDAAAAIAALKAGDIQVLSSVSTSELPAVRQTSGLRVLQLNQHGWKGVLINLGNRNGVGNLPYENVGTSLASNVKLRQAFEEAIDRNTMNKVVFGGLMQVSCTPIAPANTPWYEATKIPCTPYDPGHAKKLVAASGVPNPTVRLLTAGTTDNLRLAQFIQEQEHEVGIDVVIDSTDNPTDIARRTSGAFDADLFGYFPGDGDPNMIIYQPFLSSGGRNYGGYSNARLDLLLENGRKASSVQARSTLYRAAQQIIQSERPIVFLFNEIRFAALSTSVTGVQPFNGGAAMYIGNAQLR